RDESFHVLDSLASEVCGDSNHSAGRWRLQPRGERINPTGRKVLAAEMKVGTMDRVRADAIAQPGRIDVERFPRTEPEPGVVLMTRTKKVPMIDPTTLTEPSSSG